MILPARFSRRAINGLLAGVAPALILPRKSVAGLIGMSGGTGVPVPGGGGGSEGWSAQSGYTITGGVAFGDTVTVTNGSNPFGSKPNGEKCLYFKDWEGGDTGYGSSTTFCRSAQTPTTNANVSVQSGTVPPGGVNAFQMAYNNAGTGDNDAFLGPMGDATGLYMYLYARTRLNFDGVDAFNASNPPTQWNQKWWRFRPPSGGEPNNLIVPAYGTSSSDITGNPRFTAELTAASDFDGWSIATFKNAWCVEQVRLLQSSAVNAADADVFHIVNGVTESSLNFISRDTAESGLYTRLYSPQQEIAGDWGSSSFRFWMGVIYLDDSWCHAVLSDSATYSESAGDAHEICPILAWDTGEVQIYLRPRTGLTHLHFMKSDGSTVYAGALV